MENSKSYKFNFSYEKLLDFGKALFVNGSANELGGWDVKKAIRLNCQFKQVWIKQIEISCADFEYNFFISDFVLNPEKIEWLNDFQNFCIHENTLKIVSESINEKVKIMSFNLRYENTKDGENCWDNRKDLAMEIVESNFPDILCIQEGRANQVNYVKSHLRNHYKYYGLGRNSDYTGEQCGIFFNKHKYVLTDSNQFWLSDTPSVPGSITFGNYCPRTVTWVKLAKISDLINNIKTEYFVFNTHFDNVSLDSRLKSALFLLSQVKEVTKNSKDYVVFLAGDFNSEDREAAIKIIKSGGFISTAEESKNYEYTLHNFTGYAVEKIDHIFYKNSIHKNHLTLSFEVIKTKKTLYPSDHFPIMAEVDKYQ